MKINRLTGKVRVGKSAISSMESAAKLGKTLPIAGIVLDTAVDQYLNPDHSFSRSAVPATGGAIVGTGGTALLTTVLTGTSTTPAVPVAGGILLGWGTSKVIEGIMDGSIDRYFKDLRKYRHEALVGPNGRSCLY